MFVDRFTCPNRSCVVILLLCGLAGTPAAAAPKPKTKQSKVGLHDVTSLRLAVKDLVDTFGPKYARGQEFLRQATELEQAAQRGAGNLESRFKKLKREALLANPLLDFGKLILLKRKHGQLGLPVNHKCNAGLPQTGYDNEIAVLSVARPQGQLETLFRPEGGRFVGEFDLHFDANQLLFSMPYQKSWHIWEIGVDGKGLRQISQTKDSDIDCFDGCYLPDGRIVFASTASYTAVPCWHGQQRACSIFQMDAAGNNMRQLCFDQDLDLHPAVLPSGQVIFSRWDYTGTMHMYLRPLMAMNPDGTGQRAVYGSNSYWPNALYFPRGVPGVPNKIVAIVSGYHGAPRMGELALLDIGKGTYEAQGIVQMIPGRGRPIETVIRDNLVDKSWPKFLHPFPLSEKYFLVAAQLRAKSCWGIYLVDVFDNMLPICADERFDFFEPIPLQKTPRPPVIPDRVDLTRNDATVHLHDIYSGPGLAGVPRGTVRQLRVLAYHFGYPGMAGPDKIGCGGPWEAMRILGTVPVERDGSAMFTVPANTPISVQPLDDEGKAVQLMRSWFTPMPGEVVSCVGCHETLNETPDTRYDLAAQRGPSAIQHWYGPPRGFDFERDVQPALNRHCIGCHNGEPSPQGKTIADLRAKRFIKNYAGRPLTGLGSQRLHPELRECLGGDRVKYTPAYEALLPYVRRVGIEDDVRMLVPGEYHADTSELIQMLHKGHHGVALDDEAWDRLVTWIDLNAPCHGTWSGVGVIPEKVDRRRQELQQRYGGPGEDFEAVPDLAPSQAKPIAAKSPAIGSTKLPALSDWPFDTAEAQRRQGVAQPREMTIDLGEGVQMQMVRIPPGQFVMGSTGGPADERPATVVDIDAEFWISACEVTNQQFRRFAPDHQTGFFMKRYPGMDGPGLALDGAQQPVIRVSWEQAMAFCRWLSQRSGTAITLPSEAQWEYACRAGSAAAMSYGAANVDFSAHANLADQALAKRPGRTGGLESSITASEIKGIILEAAIGGDVPCNARYNDGAVATAAVGKYRPNAWGLFDMHGNVAEWTRSVYRPYPYDPRDGRQVADLDADRNTKMVVRGGSFVDRPKRARAAFRLAYPAWQRVHNVGFRVIAAAPPAPTGQ